MGMLAPLLALAALSPAAALAAAAAPPPGAWVELFTKEGITVSTRTVAGRPIKEARGFAVIDVPAERLKRGMADRAKFSRVVPDVVESRRIGSCGEGCDLVYERIHHPPLKDRHIVMEVRGSETKTKEGVRLREWWKKAARKPGDKYMEVVDMYGSWDFMPAEGGKKTRVTYEYYVDVGGVAFAFFVNWRLPDSTFQIMRALRKEAARW